MKKSAKKALVLVVGVIAAFILFAGCEEENVSDTKSIITKSRLQAAEKAAENRRLRKEIKDLKGLHKKELKKQEMALERCLRDKRSLEELSSKGVDEYMKNILGPLIDENRKLRKENENLKSKIKTLQAQIKQLKKQREELIEELRKGPALPDKPQPL